jgi:hypothetical protein
MKKLYLILIIILSLAHAALCQTVDSIRVEQVGDFIKIHYKILNSNQYQVFRVTVFCSINGGLKAELKSIMGDFGEDVTGGKPEYTVLWDVLKDVDEVKSVDFSVKAELLKDDTPLQKGKLNKSHPAYWSKERFYVIAAAVINFDYFMGGGRIGYMGSWGVSVSMFTGQKRYTIPTDKTTYNSMLSAIDITKRITNKDHIQLHVLAGIAFGDHEGSDASTGGHQPNMRWGIDLGLVAGIKRIALYAGFSSIKAPFFTEYDSDGTSSFDFGVGVRF